MNLVYLLCKKGYLTTDKELTFSSDLSEAFNFKTADALEKWIRDMAYKNLNEFFVKIPSPVAICYALNHESVNLTHETTSINGDYIRVFTGKITLIESGIQAIVEQEIIRWADEH